MESQCSVGYLAILFCTGLVAVAEGVCKNSGRPIFGLYPRCSCPDGYKGYDCGDKVTLCEVNPCRNAGWCVDNYDGTFTCKCPAFYEGILCEKKVVVHKPCDSAPCKNGGICSNEEDGKFKCNCPSGHIGLVCDETAPVFNSTVLKGNREWIEQLKKWLPSDQKGVMKLCYSSSKNGRSPSKFHSLCDYRGPTVVLGSSGKYVFGGYASKSWGGPTRYMAANKSFVFSFVNKDGLKPFKSPLYKNFDRALRTDVNYLPIFGDGYDLTFGSQGGNVGSSKLGITYKLPHGYEPNTWAAMVLLAGEPNPWITNVEVFYFVTVN